MSLPFTLLRQHGRWPLVPASVCTHVCTDGLQHVQPDFSKAVSNAIPNLTILTTWNISLFTFPISIFGTEILMRKQIHNTQSTDLCWCYSVPSRMQGPGDTGTENHTVCTPHSLLCTSTWLLFSTVFVNVSWLFQKTGPEREMLQITLFQKNHVSEKTIRFSNREWLLIFHNLCLKTHTLLWPHD